MPHETQFVIEPRNKFVEANRFLVEREIRSSVTVTFQHLVDLTQVDAVRSAAAADGRPRPSYTAFVVKAVAGALREFPYANR
ncbi:MAG TPA: 2-oxo acid dehydrogenase subunit E2, partial [Pirellulales bacterium]|nr:2-oxo acid dehydrogenase subunit E2 [Pirellulales bacterium]